MVFFECVRDLAGDYGHEEFAGGVDECNQSVCFRDGIVGFSRFS